MQIQGETFINKLILLFVFDKMESALSERTIIDMCSTSNDWINYMDCVMIISQLLEDGFICTVETNDDTLYTITPTAEAASPISISIFRKAPEKKYRYSSKTTARAIGTARNVNPITTRIRTALIPSFCEFSRLPSLCWN